MGTEFWTPLAEFVNESLLAVATIDPADRALFHATDDPDAAVAYVRERFESGPGVPSL